MWFRVEKRTAWRYLSACHTEDGIFYGRLTRKEYLVAGLPLFCRSSLKSTGGGVLKVCIIIYNNIEVLLVSRLFLILTPKKFAKAWSESQ